MNRDQYIASVKASFVTISTRSAIAGLVSIGMPPFLTKIVEPFVGYIMKVIVDAAEMGVFFQYIEWRVADQSLEWQDAVAQNQAAQLSGSERDKKRAEENLIIAARKFIKLTN